MAPSAQSSTKDRGQGPSVDGDRWTQVGDRRKLSYDQLLPLVLEAEDVLWRCGGAGNQAWTDVEHSSSEGHLDSPQQVLDSLSSTILRHGSSIVNIHNYFGNLESRKCCFNLAGEHPTFGSFRRVRQDDNDLLNADGPILRRQTSGKFVDILSEKEFEVYGQSLLCALYPILGVPRPPTDHSPPSSGDSPKEDGYGKVNSSVDSPTFALGEKGEESADSDAACDVDDLAACVIPTEILCDLLRQVFGLSGQRAGKYERRVLEGYRKKSHAKILVEELANQLSLLENDTHPFYSPRSFLTREAYDQWKHTQRRRLAELVDKFWQGSLPSIKASQKSDSRYNHRNYELLLERLMAYEAGYRGDGPVSGISRTLSTASQRLLKEFGLRYGVGELFQRAAQLTYLSEHFEAEVWYMRHMVNLIRTILRSFPSRRSRVVMVKEEYNMLYKAAMTIHEQCEHSLTHMESLFWGQPPEQGIGCLIDLLKCVLDLKAYLLDKNQNPLQEFLLRYAKINVSNSYRHQKLVAITDLQMNPNEAPTPKLVNRLIVSARDQVPDYSAKYRTVFSRYFDIVLLSAQCFYAHLMNDVALLCRKYSGEQVRNELNLQMLSVCYRLNQLDTFCKDYIPLRYQHWRLLFKKEALSWLSVLEYHCEQLTMQAVGADKFVRLEVEEEEVMPSPQHRPPSSTTSMTSSLTPSVGSAFEPVHVTRRSDKDASQEPSLRDWLTDSMQLEASASFTPDVPMNQAKRTYRRSRGHEATTETSFTHLDFETSFTIQTEPINLFEEETHHPPSPSTSHIERSLPEEHTEKVENKGVLESSMTDQESDEQPLFKVRPGEVSRALVDNSDRSISESNQESCNVISSQSCEQQQVVVPRLTNTDVEDEMTKHVDSNSRVLDKFVESRTHFQGEGSTDDFVEEIREETDENNDSADDFHVSSSSIQTNPPSLAESLRLLSGRLMVSGSLIDITAMLQRLISFGKVLAQTLYPLSVLECNTPLHWQAELSETEEHNIEISAKHKNAELEILAARTAIYEKTNQVLSSVMCLYADNLLCYDLCGIREKEAVELANPQLVSRLKGEFSEALIWGCRHMSQGKANCSTFVNRKSCRRSETLEPITEQMSLRVNNVRSLQSVLTHFQNKMISEFEISRTEEIYRKLSWENMDPLLEGYVVVATFPPAVSYDRSSNMMESPSVSAIRESVDSPKSLSSSVRLPPVVMEPFTDVNKLVFTQCDSYLSSVWQLLANLLAYRVNQFFHRALCILLSMGLPMVNMQARLHPLTDFLDNHLEALRSWLSEEAFQSTLQKLWSHIAKDFQHEAMKLIQLNNSSNIRPEVILQSLAFFMKYFYSPGEGLPLPALAEKVAKPMYWLELHTLSTANLIYLYRSLEFCLGEESESTSTDSGLPSRGFLLRMRVDLHGEKKSFSGKDLVDWMVRQKKTALHSHVMDLPGHKDQLDEEAALELAQIMMDRGLLIMLGESRAGSEVSSILQRESLTDPYPHLSLDSHGLPSEMARWLGSESSHDEGDQETNLLFPPEGPTVITKNTGGQPQVLPVIDEAERSVFAEEEEQAVFDDHVEDITSDGHHLATPASDAPMGSFQATPNHYYRFLGVCDIAPSNLSAVNMSLTTGSSRNNNGIGMFDQQVLERSKEVNQLYDVTPPLVLRVVATRRHRDRLARRFLLSLVTEKEQTESRQEQDRVSGCFGCFW